MEKLTPQQKIVCYQFCLRRIELNEFHSQYICMNLYHKHNAFGTYEHISSLNWFGFNGNCFKIFPEFKKYKPFYISDSKMGWYKDNNVRIEVLKELIKEQQMIIDNVFWLNRYIFKWKIKLKYFLLTKN